MKTTKKTDEGDDFLPDIFGIDTPAGGETSYDGRRFLVRLLSGCALTIFLLGPFISSITAFATQPHDGSGAAWAPVGLVNGIILWGVMSIVGASLGLGAMTLRRTVLSYTSFGLNMLVAVPFILLCIMFMIGAIAR